jgi:hypothetical protein
MAFIRFICPFCKDEFSNPEQLRQHRLGNHRNAINEVEPLKRSRSEKRRGRDIRWIEKKL